jgi:hypothetical protein
LGGKKLIKIAHTISVKTVYHEADHMLSAIAEVGNAVYPLFIL